MATKTKTITKKTTKLASKATVKTREAKLRIASFDHTGAPVKDTLVDKFITVKVSPRLLAQVIRGYQISQRQGTQSTKTRGEVAGSTRKIYRQKGTGRARHGSNKAPIFVGGGITFGPKPRKFESHIPQKMRQKALLGLLADKIQTKQVSVVSGLKQVSGKTRDMDRLLTKMGVTKNRVLLVIDSSQEKVKKAARNLEFVTIRPVSALSSYDVVRSAHIVLAEEILPALNKTQKV